MDSGSGEDPSLEIEVLRGAVFGDRRVSREVWAAAASACPTIARERVRAVTGVCPLVVKCEDDWSQAIQRRECAEIEVASMEVVEVKDRGTTAKRFR
jgi:hypothetical protein